MQLKFARNVLAGAALVAGLAVVTPNTASAQTNFVLQANYGDDYDFGVGGGVGFGLGSLTAKQGIRGEATFDYYFPGNNLNYWEANGNLLMDIKSVTGVYVGAGVNYGHTSADIPPIVQDACEFIGADNCNGSDSRIALNLLGGYSFGGNKSPFVQAKIEVGSGSTFVVTGGIRF